MNANDWLIRATAWVAFGLYIGKEAMSRHRNSTDAGLARWLNSFGCAALLMHILCAYHFRHGWSQAAAYADTARQTAALTGWNWGGGLYINYLFGLMWIGVVVRSWARPGRGTRAGTWMIRGFFFFMFVNATVIFVQGSVRWIGLAGCLILVAMWVRPEAN